MVELTLQTSLHLALILTGVMLTILLLLCINTLNQRRVQNNYESMKEYIVHKLPQINPKKDRFIEKNRELFLDIYIEIKQNLYSDPIVLESAEKYIKNNNFERKYIKHLKSRKKLTRIEAVSYLGNIDTEKSRQALIKQLAKERNLIVKTYLINALTNLRETRAIPPIIENLLDTPDWFQERVCNLLCEFQKDLHDYLPEIMDSKKPEHIHLIQCFAANYIAEDLKEYILVKLTSEDEDVVTHSLQAIENLYPTELMHPKFLTNSNPLIKKTAIQALTSTPTLDNLQILIDQIEDENGFEDTKIYAVSTIIRKKPEYSKIIVDKLLSCKDQGIKSIYTSILSSRTEYYILKLLTRERDKASKVLTEIITSGKISNIIGFMNKNNNIELENELVSIIHNASIDTATRKEFCIYLDERILEKFGWEQVIVPRKRRVEEMERDKIAFLYKLLLLIILFFPLLYIWNHYDQLYTLTLVEHIKLFTGDFVLQFTVYIIAANLIYISLLVLSLIEVADQAKSWKVKNLSLLFKKKILPSISILAPAYGEEATIIESMNSLLGLVYPDFQLVVINDGSPDNTLQVVVDYFKLEKVDQVLDLQLNTQPIRGIYKNPSYPNLVVVDKANGGKADALNVGINVASKDYICCIDSDSLLEPTALQKIAARSLDYEEEMVATGGNILPINGCVVERGSIVETSVPRNHLARLQTIEYLRAFMAGRLGWTSINSLLIISGAFGLFKRERMLEIGGYLTSSERYKKDTVGEDMELVVRLSRNMREKNVPYRVQHVYNANCWTEVPEDWNILHKQRDRWHRGLVDILYFHKKLLFNPLYGNMGLVSFPYFFIFEVVGSFFEFFGYLAILSQVILGMLDYPTTLVLFSANILLGIIISLMGLFISRMHERDNYFSFRDIMILSFYAFIENFGIRQYISLWRVGGYINSLKKPKGWGKMVRKGFSSKK